MCEKCKENEESVRQLAKEVYESKGVKIPNAADLFTNLQTLMMKRERKVHVVVEQGVFFFEKGAIFQTDDDGVHRFENHSVTCIGIEDLMQNIIGMLMAYEQATELNLISDERMQYDLTALLEYVTTAWDTKDD